MTVQAKQILQRESGSVDQAVRAEVLLALVLFSMARLGDVHPEVEAIIAQHASTTVAHVVAAHLVTAANLFAAVTAQNAIVTIRAKEGFANIASIASTANPTVALLAFQFALWTVVRPALSALIPLPQEERLPADFRPFEQTFMVLAARAMAHPQFRGQSTFGGVECCVLHGTVYGKNLWSV